MEMQNEMDVRHNVIEKSTVHMDCVRMNLKNVNAWDQKKKMF